jgi:hypothetical protein
LLQESRRETRRTDQELIEAASPVRAANQLLKSELRAAKHFPARIQAGPSTTTRTFITVLRELDADYLISHLPR